MIIDTFIYNGEKDILAFRLAMLWDYVDFFVIIEGTHTFSGKEKELTLNKEFLPCGGEEFNKNWDSSKIIYYPFTPDISGLDLTSKPTQFEPTHDCWKIEYQQRNAIIDACAGFPDDAIIIISDADEIPSREVIEWVAKNPVVTSVVCDQAFFYYNLKHLRLEQWNGSVITTLKEAREVGTQRLRDVRHNLPKISPGGFHLSYFGDIAGKIEAFSHQELNVPQFKDAGHIERCRTTGADLFNRGTRTAEIDKSFFPQYFLNNAPSGWFE